MQGGSGDGSPRRPRLALLQMMRRTLGVLLSWLELSAVAKQSLYRRTS